MRISTITALTLICFTIISACQKTPSYKIIGTVLGTHEGDSVELQIPIGREIVLLQQGIIKDGKFTLKGRKDTADVCFIHTHSGGSAEFILENKEIQITIDPNSSFYDIKGTPVNEIWCAFHNELVPIFDERLELYSDLNDSTLTWPSTAVKEREIEACTKKIDDRRLQFCRDNIQNIAGAYTLMSFQYAFDPKEVARLAAQIPNSCDTEEVMQFKDKMGVDQKITEGQPFIDFTLETTNGKVLSVSEVEKTNKITIIYFWGSWDCSEMKSIKNAYNKYHEKGLEIIGISLDNNKNEWKNTIEHLKLKWPHTCDLKGWNSEGAFLYGVRSIPTTFLIQNGKITMKNLHNEDIDKILGKILD